MEAIEKTTTEETAVEETAVKKDRVKWFFDKESRVASCQIGQAQTMTFDLSSIIPLDATETQKALYFYGFKQWVASNWASFKDESGKNTSATQDYENLIKVGLEIVPGKDDGPTQIRIVGKIRKTADPDKAQVSKSHLNSQTWSLNELLTLQKAKVPFTPEMTEILLGLQSEAEKQAEINTAASKKSKK